MQFIKPSHTFYRRLQWPTWASVSCSWTRRTGAAKDRATCSTSWHTARRALIKSSWKCRLFFPSLHTHSLTSRCSRKLKACMDITAAVSSVLSCPVKYTKTREDGWVVALYMWWHTDGTLSTLKEVNKYQITAGRHNAGSLISLTHYFGSTVGKKILENHSTRQLSSGRSFKWLKPEQKLNWQSFFNTEKWDVWIYLCKAWEKQSWGAGDKRNSRG